jgi:hypothetical protein
MLAPGRPRRMSPIWSGAKCVLPRPVATRPLCPQRAQVSSLASKPANTYGRPGGRHPATMVLPPLVPGGWQASSPSLSRWRIVVDFRNRIAMTSAYRACRVRLPGLRARGVATTRAASVRWLGVLSAGESRDTKRPTATQKLTAYGGGAVTVDDMTRHANPGEHDGCVRHSPALIAGSKPFRS